MLGRTLGSYRLQAHIGSGGMGVVYRAEHTLIGRQAAVKVLLPEYSQRQDLIKRFFNEAKAAASAQHPGIVEVYDFGRAEDGTAYLVMELLEGDTLWQRLRREKRLPERRALLIARQIAAALAAAHHAGVIHRDLKPGNIFLLDSDDPSGMRVKLMDFGVAKLMRDDSAAEGLTTTGAIVGTPVYMSPEQCRGGGTPIDWRSDIYSLGCILFAMLSGRPPFIADGSGAVLAMHIYEPSPRVKDFAQVSDDVDRLVQQLLSKRPDDRAKEIREVAGLLAQLAPTEEGRTARPAPMPLPTTVISEDAVTAPRKAPQRAATPSPVAAAPTPVAPTPVAPTPVPRPRPPPVAFPPPATTLRRNKNTVPGPAGAPPPRSASPPPSAPGGMAVPASAVAATVREVSPAILARNPVPPRFDTPVGWPDGTPTAQTTLPPPPASRVPHSSGGGLVLAVVLVVTVLGGGLFALFQLGVFGDREEAAEPAAEPPPLIRAETEPVPEVRAEADEPEPKPMTVVKDPAPQPTAPSRVVAEEREPAPAADQPRKEPAAAREAEKTAPAADRARSKKRPKRTKPADAPPLPAGTVTDENLIDPFR